MRSYIHTCLYSNIGTCLLLLQHQCVAISPLYSRGCVHCPRFSWSRTCSCRGQRSALWWGYQQLTLDYLGLAPIPDSQIQPAANVDWEITGLWHVIEFLPLIYKIWIVFPAPGFRPAQLWARSVNQWLRALLSPCPPPERTSKFFKNLL